MINTTKMKQDAEEGLRIAEKAPQGPYRQLPGNGHIVGADDYLDTPTHIVTASTYPGQQGLVFINPNAMKLFVDARTRAPEAYRNVIALVEALESEQAPMSPEDEKLVREARERYEKAYDSFWKGDPDDSNGPRIAFAGQDVPALCDLADRQATEIERLSAELAQCKADAARLGALACDRQFTDG